MYINNIEILKVSSKSEPRDVAGMIANLIKEEKRVEIQVVGAGAANQALKSIIIARGYIAPGGYDLSCVPAFCDVEINGELRTGIKFIVKIN